MNRFRNILLSGLVALLMVGMVYAGEETETASQSESVDSLIGMYTGGWAGTICVDELDGGCIKIWISFDFSIIKNLFF